MNELPPVKRPPVLKGAAKAVDKIMSPIDHFMHLEASSGILLLVVTAIALFLANSTFHEAYEHFIHTPIGFNFGSFELKMGLQHWVNDALMAIFFFVVGMEIKRELVKGELSTPKQAALPMFAALGGMLVPALIYVFFNAGTENISGWGIPMATDIAFAVGILSLMSKRVPFSLKVFLLALAIVDDLGAVLVIAFFYTSELSTSAFAIAGVSLGLIILLMFSGIEKVIIYIILGLIFWFSVLQSGIHATIAGVILGFLVPTAPIFNKKLLPGALTPLLDDIHKKIDNATEQSEDLSATAHREFMQLKKFAEGAESPLDRTINTLHIWVGFVIMPLFALVNAGVHIGDFNVSEFVGHPVSLGVILGLVVGKPIGVVLFSFLAVKMKISSLPQGVTWYHITCAGLLAGIGFTMAIFISNLALTDPTGGTYSKLGILVASVLASVVGLIMLGFSKAK